jgi:hypothetical protein
MVCLAAQACSLAFTPPTVRVAEVRISSVAFTGGSAQVDLEVENPNGYALESRDFRYALALRRLLRSGELEYRFTGEIVAGTPLGSRRIPIDQRGRFRP